MKTQPKTTDPRGGPVNIWLPGPLRAKLLAIKEKHRVSWSKLLELLLARR